MNLLQVLRLSLYKLPFFIKQYDFILNTFFGVVTKFIYEADQVVLITTKKENEASRIDSLKRVLLKPINDKVKQAIEEKNNN